MKQQTLFLVLFSFSWLLPLLAKHEGSYVNEARMTLKTPHAAWDEKSDLPRRKVLFILPQTASREIIELRQRFPGFLCETVLTASEKALGSDDIYANQVEGLSSAEKLNELERELEKNYDIVVMGNVHFSILPDEQKFRLLSMIRNGCGLVRIQSRESWKKLERIPYRKPYAEPLPRPEWVSLASELPGVRPNDFEQRIFNAWRFGKGRIIEVDYGAGYQDGVALTPFFQYDYDWFFQYETSQVFLARLLYYASGWEIPAIPVRKDRGAFIMSPPPGTDASGRIRNQENAVIRNNLDFQGLPAGKYAADFLLREKGKLTAFMTHPFLVESAFGALSVEAPRVVNDRRPFRGKLRLASAAKTDLRVQAELLDAPYRNIWSRKMLSVPKGAQEISFEMQNYRMPAIGGYLRCTVSNAEGESAHAECQILFPDYSLEDYIQITWGHVGCTFNPAFGERIIDRLGWNIALHFFKKGKDETAFRNEKICPYVTRIELTAGPKGEVRFPRWWFLPQAYRKDWRELGGDESFCRPEVRRLWSLSVRSQASYLKDLSPVLYNLGDENHFTYDAGFGKSDRKGFADFLQEKYGDIGNLNSEYEADYPDFASVPHLRPEEAKRTGNLIAFNDHREYVEKMYVDLHHFLAAEIKKVDPRARVGAEGSPAGNLEKMLAGLDFWGPYSNMIGNEALRAFGADRIRTIWWGGYCSQRASYPYKLWEHLIQGAINGHAWFIINPALSESSHAGDLSEAEYLRNYMPFLDDLNYGIAHLLIRTPLPDDGILFHYSHASAAAAAADSRCVKPEASLNPLLRYCYQRGLGFNFTSLNTLERLQSAKILFLCGTSALSDRECAAILAFTERGGITVADANIAILNENLKKRRKNPLAALFGDLTFETAKELEILPYAAAAENLTLRAGKAYAVPGNPGLRIRKYGRGKAVLLNASLSVMENNSASDAPLNGFLDRLMQTAGVEAMAAIPDFSNDLMVRPRKMKGFEMLAALCREKDIGRVLHAELKKSKYIYECRKGLIGQSPRLAFDFSKTPFHCFALFEKKQSPPILQCPGTVNRGGRVILRISGPEDISGRVYRITLTGPDGQEIRNRSRTVCGKSEYLLDFAYGDPVGDYCIAVSDAATGLSAKHKIKVK